MHQVSMMQEWMQKGEVIKKRGNMKRRMEDKVGDQGDKEGVKKI